jgi:Fic family protein
MCMKRVAMNMMKPDVPANDLPLLPLDADIETKPVLRHAISANRELARLKGYCSLLPNETLLLNTIVLKEARASSEIENIVTTQDELYRALAADDRQMTPETKEVLNYRSGGIRSLPGTALRNDRTGEAVYTPPDDETVIRNLLDDLERYINEDDGVDPLIKMAVIHYQFESIHPFYDGNGRTGRILNVLYLILHKPQYYALLQRVRTESAWVPWIEFMITAVEEISRLTMDLTQAIVSLMEQTTETARQTLPRTTYSKELIELLFVQPYVKIENLVSHGIAERRTASKYLKQLEQIGILDSYKAWKETIYINRRLMELLNKAG